MKKLSNNVHLQATIAAVILLLLHWFSENLERGWLSWSFCLPPLAIILFTALARLNDITAIGTRWFVRRIGYLLAAGGSLAVIAAPLMGYATSFPSWRVMFLFWGIALAWITTPNMPPWWKYVSGEWKLKKGEQA